eukprot:Nitzschia sp. Nitz4//scaffold195_size40117//3373//4610//NITZ4_007572-RA/size40117-augustus-gene-0.32-mRNA-1//-1//CDS//3329540353//692//frame0
MILMIPGCTQKHIMQPLAKAPSRGQFSVILCLALIVCSSFLTLFRDPVKQLKPQLDWGARKVEDVPRRPPSLLELVDDDPTATCEDGLVRIHDSNRDLLQQNLRTKGIPKVVHITSKSRCLHPAFLDVIDKWRFEGYTVMIHDETAVDRLFGRYFPEFPELQKAAYCIFSGAGKADLWRGIVLWLYGGIYTDVDTAPREPFLNGTIIQPLDETFFVVESGGWLSQYFMAAEPRHPLMYLYISKIIQRLYSLNDVGKQHVARTTGPGPLKYAFIAFMNDQGPNIYEGFGSCNGNREYKYGQVTKGHYVGWNNRTVTVVGEKGWPQSDYYIQRNAVAGKDAAYKAMNMTHFEQSSQQAATSDAYGGKPCFRIVYENQHSWWDHEDEDP